ncbi:unnamed protein product [Ectocarpus sp. CCAP 1310/34]|nr:unnamed protein product [Ectocarpus sp. CCAP 1310/34]
MIFVLSITVTHTGTYEEAKPLLIRSLAISAELLYNRAQEILEKLLGREHPNIVIVLNNRAMMLWNQSKFGEADPLYVRAIAVGEKTLGPEHPNLAAWLNNRAALLYKQGKYDEAEPLYKRTQEIWENSGAFKHCHNFEQPGEVVRESGGWCPKVQITAETVVVARGKNRALQRWIDARKLAAQKIRKKAHTQREADRGRHETAAAVKAAAKKKARECDLSFGTFNVRTLAYSGSDWVSRLGEDLVAFNMGDEKEWGKWKVSAKDPEEAEASAKRQRPREAEAESTATSGPKRKRVGEAAVGGKKRQPDTTVEASRAAEAALVANYVPG